MNFTFLRKRTVASLSGRVIEFEAGKPTYVPPGMYKEVIAVGGVPEDEVEDEEPSKPAVPEGTERDTLITAAMEELVLKNERESFTGAGAPHTKALSTIVGFTVNNKERDALWNALKQGADK